LFLDAHGCALKYLQTLCGNFRNFFIVYVTHVFKDQVDVLVVDRGVDAQESDDVWVTGERLQEHDLSIGALGVCLIGERIKDFLQCHNFFALFVHCLPNDSVSLHAKHTQEHLKIIPLASAQNSD
jgi:hypothetical protein